MEDPSSPSESEGKIPPRPSLVRIAAIFYGVLFGLALLWGALAGRSLFYASAEAASRGPAPARDLAVGLLAGAIVILLSHEVTRRTAWGEALARALASVLGSLGWGQCLLPAAPSGRSRLPAKRSFSQAESWAIPRNETYSGR